MPPRLGDFNAIVAPTDDGRRAVALLFTVADDGSTDVIGCRVVSIRRLSELQSSVHSFLTQMSKEYDAELRSFGSSGPL